MQFNKPDLVSFNWFACIVNSRYCSRSETLHRIPLNDMWVLTGSVDKLRFRKKKTAIKKTCNHAKIMKHFFPQVSQKGENQLCLEVRGTAVQLAVLAAAPPSGYCPNDGFTFHNKTKKRGYVVCLR